MKTKYTYPYPYSFLLQDIKNDMKFSKKILAKFWFNEILPLSIKVKIRIHIVYK